jgi:hypothetical protein
MADTKSHRAIKQHVANAKGSLDKIEQILSAMKEQQEPEQSVQPVQSGQTMPGGVSPMGGTAS